MTSPGPCASGPPPGLAEVAALPGCSALHAEARATGTFPISLPRSRTRGRGEAAGTRWRGLLAAGIAAVIAGSRSFAAIGQWAADAGPEVLAAIGAACGPAEESSFRRVFALVGADVLDWVLGARARAGRSRTWSRSWRTASARSSGRSPWTRRATRSGVRELLKAFTDLAGAVREQPDQCRALHLRNASMPVQTGIIAIREESRSVPGEGVD